jgi:pimeloyl-ACP methyl ester carboxylesterase
MLQVGVLAIVIAGCAMPTPSERTRTAEEIAARGAMTQRLYRTGRFSLRGYWRPGRDEGAGIRVYLEGDGLAWISRVEVSSDPTPIDPVALRMAAADPSEKAILYLARPCQYVGTAHPACQPGQWTDRRYSRDVTDAISLAIDSAMIEEMGRNRGPSQSLPAKSSSVGVELVGYSGGGVLAANVASQRADVSFIATVAAPMDLAAWVDHHEVSPLTDSLDPADLGAALARIPQLHLVGERDSIVPTAVIESYLDAIGDPPTARVVEVPGFDHRCCWARDWKKLAANLTGGQAGDRDSHSRAPADSGR